MTAEVWGRIARRRRVLPAMALTMALAGGAAACSEETDGADAVATGDVEFEATPQFVADAAERSAGEPFRYEMELAMDLALAGQSIDLDAPLMSGEQDGDLSHVNMDMGPLFDQLTETAPDAPQLDGELTMEMLADGSTMFMRTPMFETLADAAGGADQLGPAADLAELGDRWGRVDLTAFGDVLPLNAVTSAAGGQVIDPRAFFELVAGADDVTELGDDEVRDVAVQGLGADITLAELSEATGQDANQFAESLGTLPAEAEELVDSMLEMSMPVEAWIDGDGLVRRLNYSMDLVELFESAELSDQLGGDMPERLNYEVTMDLFDYGDEAIAIELPDPDEAVDVTDTFVELYESGTP